MSRGCYGRRSSVGGAGSLFGHTPGDIENELDQLHGEIMQFGNEVIAWSDQLDAKIKAEPNYNVYATQAKVMWDLIDKFPANDLKGRKGAHQNALKLQAVAADYFNKRRAEVSTWKKTTWDPFWESWSKFRSEKKDIPLQMWPGSGTWDRVQDFRKKFIDTRKGAPFAVTGPEPMSPEGRKDPSITEGFMKIAKYGVIGILGIGGILVISSIASNVRKGRDPIERYTELYRNRGRRDVEVS